MLLTTLWCVLAPLWVTTLWAVIAHAYQELPVAALDVLPKKFPPDDVLDPFNPDGYLEPILIVRKPGTENSTIVQQHFIDFFKTLSNWTLETDVFTDLTPHGPVNFTNLVFRKDPPAFTDSPADPNVRYLTLVAHYDSKVSPEGFIGAIDSAVPCALLMYVAKAVDDVINDKWNNLRALGGDFTNDQLSMSRLGVQIVFLDGEEAYETWTDEDSIYGARHLAHKWETEPLVANNNKRPRLGNIDTFVLLDLIGTRDCKIPSFSRTTHWLYNNLAVLETKLRADVQWDNYFLADTPRYLTDPRDGLNFRLGGVGDDHLPFMKRGVPILHLIPLGFPSVWHTMDDNAEHLDSEAINNWAVLMTDFVAEYMHLGDTILGKPEYGRSQYDL